MKETVMLYQCGVLQDDLVLSAKLIIWIGHCKEILKVMFLAIAFHQSKLL